MVLPVVLSTMGGLLVMAATVNHHNDQPSTESNDYTTQLAASLTPSAPEDATRLFFVQFSLLAD